MISVHSRIVAVLVAVALTGCAGSGALGRGKGKSVEELYDHAYENLKDGLYPEALSGFAQVKAKFPYSKYAALADLRTADTHFEQHKYIEAIDAYRQFMKLHPTHDEVAYAMLRIGESYDELSPDSWWFLPPAAEKDQSNVRLAISAYEDLLDRFPKGEVATKARERLQGARRALADHELYVAHFYFKRDKWRAAASRAEGLVRDYPGVGLDSEALWIAARARKQAGDASEARANAEALVQRFPTSKEAAEAKVLLSQLPAPPPRSPASEPSSQASAPRGD